MAAYLVGGRSAGVIRLSYRPGGPGGPGGGAGIEGGADGGADGAGGTEDGSDGSEDGSDGGLGSSGGVKSPEVVVVVVDGAGVVVGVAVATPPELWPTHTAAVKVTPQAGRRAVCRIAERNMSGPAYSLINSPHSGS
jgi:hypothetical protein